MAIQPLTALPIPPLTTDNEATFNEKTDATLLAQKAFVDEMNALTIPGINQAVIDAASAKNAAAESASAAAQSAESANTAKVAAQKAVTDTTAAGVVQVNLAKDQVALAVVAKDSAQAFAAGAQAAVGAPSLAGNDYKVLGVLPGGTGVGWRFGLPDYTNAKTGQCVMWGADKKPYWGNAGHQIGDTLVTSRNPGALYLPKDGSIRSQAAYPLLFPLIGLIGGNLGEAWATVSTGAIPYLMVPSANGTTLALTNTSGTILRSTNRGTSWAPITLSGYTLTGLATNGTGRWIGMTNLSGPPRCAISEDDGQTWTLVNLPAIASGEGAYTNAVVHVGAAVWLCFKSSSATAIRTADNGATWDVVDPNFGSAVTVNRQYVDSDGAGVVVICLQNLIRRSGNFAASFTTVTPPNTNLPNGIASDRKGSWLITSWIGNSPYTNSNSVSVDNGVSFQATPYSAESINAVLGQPTLAEGIFWFRWSTGIYSYSPATNRYTKSAQSGANFTNIYGPGAGVLLSTPTAATSVVYRSAPTYGYDTATQFRLPTQTTEEGSKAYIKALEAA